MANQSSTTPARSRTRPRVRLLPVDAPKRVLRVAPPVTVTTAPSRRADFNRLGASLVATDLVALASAAAVFSSWTWPYAAFVALVVISRVSARTYRRRLRLSVLDDLPRAVATAGISISVVVFSGLTLDASRSALTGELDAAATFFAISFVLHTAVLYIGRQLRRQGRFGERTLVVGSGRIGIKLAVAMADHPELGLRPVGFMDPEHPSAFGVDHPLPHLTKDMTSLVAAIEEHRVSSVVVAFGTSPESQLVDLTIAAHSRGCSVLIVPRFFELHADGPDVERIRGIPLVRLRRDPTMRPSWWVKVAVDRAVAAVVMLLLAPVLAAVAIAVLVESGRPILFWQERVGLDGRTFRLCKFRSMRPVAETVSQATWSIASDSRVGPVGKFLRASSLDETPQLWNIMRGEMSLVGPRPERPNFVEQFNSQHERYWARHRVPVGLTGLAQVNGLRGDTSISERERYDNYYIANWSLWFDVKIIILTLREVVSRSGS